MKKAQGLPLNTIVLAVLALIVLVLLIWLVKTQVQKGSQKYLNISGEAEREAKAKDVCETLFALRSRVCADACDPKDFVQLPGEWSDCKAKKKTACCESIT